MSHDSPSVALFGAGAMGSALVRGWLGAVRNAGGLILQVHDPNFNPDLAAELEAAGAVVNPPVPDPAEAVVIAVKPQQFTDSAAKFKALISADTLVISVMAGMTLGMLSKTLETDRVVRAMPNTAGQIGRGVTAYVAGSACTPDDRKLVAQLLEPLGAVEPIREERLMDVVTAVSGSGPAYVFLMVEVLAAAAEKEGLDSETAMRLARQTVAGAGALLQDSPLSPTELRRLVTSPGGTTQAALDVLQSGDGLAPVIRRAISAAIQRSRDMGKTL